MPAVHVLCAALTVILQTSTTDEMTDDAALLAAVNGHQFEKYKNKTRVECMHCEEDIETAEMVRTPSLPCLLTKATLYPLPPLTRCLLRVGLSLQCVLSCRTPRLHPLRCPLQVCTDTQETPKVRGGSVWIGWELCCGTLRPSTDLSSRRHPSHADDLLEAKPHQPPRPPSLSIR